MTLLDTASLDALTEKARSSTRRRMNLNIHVSPDDPVQRMCNAIEPGTYIRPHRHADPATMEFFLMLRGSAVLLIFDDAGTVIERIVLSAQGPVISADIPAGTWHAMASLESGTIFFEVKQGPYVRPAAANFVSWAPEEGSVEVEAIIAWYQKACVGASFRESPSS